MDMNYRNQITSCLASLTFSLILGSLLMLPASSADARGSGAARPNNMARSSISSANRNDINTGNRGGNKINTGDVNRNRVNIGNDVDIDIDGGYNNHWHGGYYDHPIAAGIAIGAVAVTTAAIVGSYYYALPPSGCTVVIKNGISYHYCGSVYYQKSWYGNDVVYVVVNP
jgi:hypothetical protein